MMNNSTMQYLYKVCLCCVFTIVLHRAALADKEDKSDETSEAQERSEMVEGSLDSHEAMNNREINPITKTRQKRSYEFLMGLINNNSRYQVTKDEPAINLSKKQEVSIPAVFQESNKTGASELLLELIVKIAANPDQWRKVHHLLQQIDQDILTSTQLIEDYQHHTTDIRKIFNGGNFQKNGIDASSSQKLTEEKKRKKYTQAEINKEVAITSDNGQTDVNIEVSTSSTILASNTREWPKFPGEEQRVQFINLNTSSTLLADQTKSTNIGSTTMKAYPKYFSYHRVTGKPVFIKKNPTAYVAVSVVAPKSPDGHSNEDLELEHELRQLKPWTHSQNLKNMESIRSRWVIDSKQERKAEAEA